MKVLILGGAGMLGHKLIQLLSPSFETWTTIRSRYADVQRFGIFDESRTVENLDVRTWKDLESAMGRISPDVVINAVGIIKQLPQSNDVITTLEINSILPHRLAELTSKYGFRLITISTDCVFSGDRGQYTEDDISDARDLYGKSKNIGEAVSDHCLTLRTSIIGRELSTSHSLVEWFLSNRGGNVKGFVNAIYTGFPTIVFADIIADLIENHRELQGLYHVSSEPINKYELLTLINDAYCTDIEIERFEDFHLDRSLNSDKFRSATGFVPQNWETMIARMAEDRTPYDEWRK